MNAVVVLDKTQRGHRLLTPMHLDETAQKDQMSPWQFVVGRPPSHPPNTSSPCKLSLGNVQIAIGRLAPLSQKIMTELVPREVIINKWKEKTGQGRAYTYTHAGTHTHRASSHV